MFVYSCYKSYSNTEKFIVSLDLLDSYIRGNDSLKQDDRLKEYSKKQLLKVQEIHQN